MANASGNNVIFEGVRALRTQFSKLLPADLSGATSKATAVQWIYFHNSARFAFMDNQLTASGNPVDVALAFVHPDGFPNDNDYRLFFGEIPGGRVYNYDMISMPNFSFDAGMHIYVWYLGGAAPNAGALRIQTG